MGSLGARESIRTAKMKSEKIIEPVDRELLKAELTGQHFLRDTNHAGNKLYIVDCQSAPNVLREIGRLREIAFRAGGGGTGKCMDLDAFDLDPAFRYKQLVLWDPEAECIVGGYRYVLGSDVMYDWEGQPIMPSSHLFRFTHRFLRNHFRQTIELSRSFIRPEYQSAERGAKSLYSLDNLFDGLGGLVMLYKDRMQYFFGKMTIYPSFPQEGLEMLLYFLRKHFAPRRQAPVPFDRMVIPKKPVQIHLSRKFDKLFTEEDFQEDYKILKREIQKLGVNIPPLVNTYMNLSPTMKSFGAGINDEFGDVIEAGILIKFDELHPGKTRRHLNLPNLQSLRRRLRFLQK